MVKWILKFWKVNFSCFKKSRKKEKENKLEVNKYYDNVSSESLETNLGLKGSGC
jgi:hypothetical protein